MINYKKVMEPFKPMPLYDDDLRFSEEGKLELERLRLPECYMGFLEAFPNTIVFREEVVFKGEQRSEFSGESGEGLCMMFSRSKEPLYDLLTVRKRYLEQLPDRFFVFAAVSTINLLFMDLNDNASVKIWDTTVDGGLDKSVFKVADSFESFLQLLKIEEPVPDDGSGPRLVSRSPIDKELKEKAKEFMKRYNSYEEKNKDR